MKPFIMLCHISGMPSTVSIYICLHLNSMSCHYCWTMQNGFCRHPNSGERKALEVFHLEGEFSARYIRNVCSRSKSFEPSAPLLLSKHLQMEKNLCLIFLKVIGCNDFRLWRLIVADVVDRWRQTPKALWVCERKSLNVWNEFVHFVLQNSKPDSLLKMEEEHKFDRSLHKDNKFAFSMSHKKLLG